MKGARFQFGLDTMLVGVALLAVETALAAHVWILTRPYGLMRDRPPSPDVRERIRRVKHIDLGGPRSVDWRAYPAPRR